IAPDSVRSGDHCPSAVRQEPSTDVVYSSYQCVQIATASPPGFAATTSPQRGTLPSANVVGADQSPTAADALTPIAASATSRTAHIRQVTPKPRPAHSPITQIKTRDNPNRHLLDPFEDRRIPDSLAVTPRSTHPQTTHESVG